MRFARHVLNVETFAGLSEFYCDVLGMESFGTAGNPLFGFDPDQCLLQFRSGADAPYVPEANDFYWKIGITLRDLDAAVAYLRGRGLTVPDPRQFRDIGYMSKLNDPNGFAIELLQQGFEGNSRPAGEGHPVGGQAILAHITLRITDLAAARSFCEETLGLRLISVQPVEPFGFCLYFYCWSDEALPNADLQAIENREWLWRRPYTLLELQHLESDGVEVHRAEHHVSGFGGFAFGDSDDPNADLSYISLEDLQVLS